MARRLTHLDEAGEAHMVDVSATSPRPSARRHRRRHGDDGEATLDLILSGDAKKGDVIGTARIAGIMAAKQTSDLIPLCHPIGLAKVSRRDRARRRRCPACACARPRRSPAGPASRWRR